MGAVTVSVTRSAAETSQSPRGKRAPLLSPGLGRRVSGRQVRPDTSVNGARGLPVTFNHRLCSWG